MLFFNNNYSHSFHFSVYVLQLLEWIMMIMAKTIESSWMILFILVLFTVGILEVWICHD